MSTDNKGRSLPQSMRHRRILDVAEQNPSASITEVAAQVASATPELVEQVLEEHGDPASQSESPPEDTETTSAAASPDEEDDTRTENIEQSGTASDTSPNAAGSDEQTATDRDAATVEYNDAEDGAKDKGNDTDDAETKPDRPPSFEELPEKQQALLKAVAARPAATQADLADEFDVTRATISRWANDISGFEWRDRESFVDTVVNDTQTTDMTDQSGFDSDTQDQPQSTTEAGDETPDTTVAEIETDIEALTERVAALEDADTDAGRHHDPVFEDPELVHKIAHACLDSDAISESEELRILKRLLE